MLSIFSVGTMRCLASPTTADQTINAALKLGVNHFETAQGYGNSELYLGQALRQQTVRQRDEIFVTTKITPKADAKSMHQALEQSLSRLNLAYIDCLAIHGINTQAHLEMALAPNGCMVAIRNAQAQGLIHHVGFSSHAPLEILIQAIQSDAFSFVNLHYNYFFQRNAAAIKAAKKLDLGIFIISPADKGGLLYTPSSVLKALCAPFEPLHLTYRFLLDYPEITTLSLGPSSPNELDWPLVIQDQTHPLTTAESIALENIEATLSNQLKADQCHQCYACLSCPEEIHIPEVLRLRNLAVGLDMTDYGQYRYNMFENAGHWFPGRKAIHCTDCGDCLPRCPQKLDIPKLLRDSHQRLNRQTRSRLWESQ